MFLGGARRMWNPEIVGYLSGIRNRTSILDLTQTTLGLKKFLGFLELASLRRGRTLIILRPAFAPLAELIYPLADYFSRYIGGVLSNLPFTCYNGNIRYKKKIKGRTFVRYPSAVVLFGDQTRRVDFMVNESLCMKTPSVLLCDATTFSSAVPYHVPATSDFAAARSMTHHVLSAIKRGKRNEKLSLRRVFRSLVKSSVNKYLKKHTNVYPYTVTHSLNASSFFAADTSRRIALLKFYFGHKLHFFRPNTFRNEAYTVKLNQILNQQLNLSVKRIVKPIAILRKSIAIVFTLVYILKNKTYIPIWGTKASELIYSGIRLPAKKSIKRQLKFESKMQRQKLYSAHKDPRKHPNLLRNPYRKQQIKKLKAKIAKTTRRRHPDTLKKRRRLDLINLTKSNPSYMIRILQESLIRIKSKQKLQYIWKKLDKYPLCRKQVFMRKR